jgi:hypothetical protein
MQNLLKNNFHIFILTLWVTILFAFPHTTLAKKKEFKLPEIVKEVKGLSGNASLIANRWINKQKDFVLVEFKSGKKGVYLTNGTLTGTASDGKVVEISVPEDFKSDNPGMILDHLRALRSKLDSSEVTRTELKEQLARNAKLKKDWAKRKLKVEKQIQKTIDARIDEIFENELSSADRSVMASLESELDSQLRANIVSEIERETRKDFPDADLAELDREINKRVDKELNPRVAEEIHQLILNEKLGNNPEFEDARKLVHRVVSRNRPKIEAEVRSQFQAIERGQYIKLKNKILYGIIPPEEIDNSILGKLKRFWNKLVKKPE